MNNKGFTLLELSIVIVIIGLIVAGISAGQSLVRQAGLRSVMTSITNIETAGMAFKLQYDAVPGDMANATDYWGTGGAGACPNGLAETVDGCNGDGNKQITNNNGGGNAGEYTRAWQHMAYANVIDGSYTGVMGTFPNLIIIGGNMPEIGMSNVTGFLQYVTTMTPGPGSVINSNVLTIASSNGSALTGFISPAEAVSLEAKYDDGTVNFGKMFVGDVTGGGDCTTGVHPNSTFQLTDTTNSCAMLYKVGF